MSQVNKCRDYCWSNVHNFILQLIIILDSKTLKVAIGMAKKSRNKNHSNNFHIKFMLYMHAVKAVHTIFVFGGKKLP